MECNFESSLLRDIDYDFDRIFLILIEAKSSWKQQSAGCAFRHFKLMHKFLPHVCHFLSSHSSISQKLIPAIFFWCYARAGADHIQRGWGPELRGVYPRQLGCGLSGPRKPRDGSGPLPQSPQHRQGTQRRGGRGLCTLQSRKLSQFKR